MGTHNLGLAVKSDLNYTSDLTQTRLGDFKGRLTNWLVTRTHLPESCCQVPSLPPAASTHACATQLISHMCMCRYFPSWSCPVSVHMPAYQLCGTCAGEGRRPGSRKESWPALCGYTAPASLSANALPPDGWVYQLRTWTQGFRHGTWVQRLGTWTQDSHLDLDGMICQHSWYKYKNITCISNLDFRGFLWLFIFILFDIYHYLFILIDCINSCLLGTCRQHTVQIF